MTTRPGSEDRTSASDTGDAAVPNNHANADRPSAPNDDAETAAESLAEGDAEDSAAGAEAARAQGASVDIPGESAPAEPAEAGPAESVPDDEVEAAADLAALSGQLLSGLASLGASGSESANRPAAGGTDTPAGANDATALAEHIDEIADDMLTLLKRVQRIEQSLESLSARVEGLAEHVSTAWRGVARETDALRRDLLGERSHQAAMGVFLTVAPALDRLRAMRSGLHTERDRRTIRQLTSVIESLGGVLRNLGFVEYQAERGEPFDPARMECVGYETGEPGVVLVAVRPGYMNNGTVVRPAGVRIADPHQEASESSEEESQP